MCPINESECERKFRYTVEAKFYKTQDNFAQLVSGGANFFKWFEEAEVDSLKIEKEPCLIFKWNNTPIFVAVRSSERCVQEIEPDLRLIKDGKSLDIYNMDNIINIKEFWLE